MSREARLRQTGGRRVGRAVTVLSAGTVAVLCTGAPAHAGAAAAKPCPAPTKPADAPKYWQCLWDNVQNGLNPPKQTPRPAPEPPKPTKPAKPEPKPDKPAEPRPDKPSKPRGGSGGSSGTGPVAYSQPEGLQRYNPAASAPNLPGLLPAPQVAPGGRVTAAGPAVTLGDTRLITPVAAYERQDGRLLWVAVAAGAAGAVGALNLSVLARRPRRRPGT